MFVLLITVSCDCGHRRPVGLVQPMRPNPLPMLRLFTLRQKDRLLVHEPMRIAFTQPTKQSFSRFAISSRITLAADGGHHIILFIRRSVAIGIRRDL